MSRFLSICLLFAPACGWGATLEQLSLDEMIAKSTAIVRGRIGLCQAEYRGSIIYTRCQVDVSERWKGAADAGKEVAVPGGTTRGIAQAFPGAPKLSIGEEYVLFLWAGKSGYTQVIGLTQGLFQFPKTSTAKTTDARAATTDSDPLLVRGASAENMVDQNGAPVRDTRLEIRLSELRKQVLGGGAK